VRAIETEWHGCRFRSRLEARWAVYFEALLIDWEYEPEGFVLDDGTYYLPDFLLHGLDGKGRGGPDLYVEVKGRMSERDYRKVKEFAKHEQIYIVGDIPYCGDGRQWYEYMSERAYEWPYPYNLETVDGDPFGGYLGVDNEGRPTLFGDDSNYLRDAHEWAMNAAIDAAKQARFEHGERPEDAWGFSEAQRAVRHARLTPKQQEAVYKREIAGEYINWKKL
jgi:hypothetical protein